MYRTLLHGGSSRSLSHLELVLSSPASQREQQTQTPTYTIGTYSLKKSGTKSSVACAYFALQHRLTRQITNREGQVWSLRSHGRQECDSPTASGGALREDEPYGTVTASQREAIQITLKSPREQSVPLGRTVTWQARNVLYILLLRIRLVVTHPLTPFHLVLNQ